MAWTMLQVEATGPDGKEYVTRHPVSYDEETGLITNTPAAFYTRMFKTAMGLTRYVGNYGIWTTKVIPESGRERIY